MHYGTFGKERIEDGVSILTWPLRQVLVPLEN